METQKEIVRAREAFSAHMQGFNRERIVLLNENAALRAESDSLQAKLDKSQANLLDEEARSAALAFQHAELREWYRTSMEQSRYLCRQVADLRAAAESQAQQFEATVENSARRERELSDDVARARAELLCERRQFAELDAERSIRSKEQAWVETGCQSMLREASLQIGKLRAKISEMESSKANGLPVGGAVAVSPPRAAVQTFESPAPSR